MRIATHIKLTGVTWWSAEAHLAFGREVISYSFVADFCPQDKNSPRKRMNSLPAELPEPDEGQA
jgi:hypothetical protein